MVKLSFLFLLAATSLTSGTVHAAHAFSLYDTPKYPAGFTHFDYVNPDAPKGGELFLANPGRSTSFDKFNPYSLKGVPAAGVSSLMFETLTAGASDETATMYGLLANDMELAPDRMAM
ncbi:MAG: ABC transporter substrate-binding protein, partial [Janthinobacterium lividum]